jgi:hypothetical protein
MELAKGAMPLPARPGIEELLRRASAAFEPLDAVVVGGTLEKKRELLSCYVRKIKGDPDTDLCI